MRIPYLDDFQVHEVVMVHYAVTVSGLSIDQKVSHIHDGIILHLHDSSVSPVLEPVRVGLSGSIMAVRYPSSLSSK